METRILLVDDEEINHIAIVPLLESLNFECKSLYNAIFIKEEIQEFKPDAIILDLHMPGKDGLTTLGELKANDEMCDIPILIVKSMTDKALLNSCLEFGASDYLVKPIDFIDLKIRLKSALLISHMNKRLVKLERKHAVDAMVVSANHHFNQDLTVLKGSLELLVGMNSENLTEKQLKLIQSSLKSVNNISKTLQSMSNIKNVNYKNYIDDTRMIDFDSQ